MGGEKGVHLCVHGLGASGLAIDGYVAGIATERGDMLVDPDDCRVLRTSVGEAVEVKMEKAYHVTETIVSSIAISIFSLQLNGT
jgi:hypothetical protein